MFYPLPNGGHATKTLDVEVEVGLVRGAGGVDRVLLNYQDPVLRIHSTTAVAAAWGFHHFLKYRLCTIIS